MTVKSMKKYLETGKSFKLKDIKRFWDTHPTEEQERLRSRISMWALLYGFLFGLYCAIAFAFCFGAYLYG